MKHKKLIISLLALVVAILLIGLFVKFYGEAVLFSVTNRTQVLQTKTIYNQLSKDRDNLFQKRISGNIEYSDVLRESYLNYHKEGE